MIKIFSSEITPNEYFIDGGNFKIYRNGCYDKMFEIKTNDSRNCLSVKLTMYDDIEKQRTRMRNVSVPYIVGRYVYGLKRKFYFKYKDGNKYNVTRDNIEICYLSDMGLEWKQCNENKRVYISSRGDVYNDETASFVEPSVDRVGYYHVTVPNVRNYKRSQLVWEYFGDCKVGKGYVIDHINNIACDDRIENLQCITVRENIVKDKTKRSNLPTGVTVDRERYIASIHYTLKNNSYDVNLGSFKTAEEASECYQRALNLVEHGIDPIKRGENSEIKYRFSNGKWYFRIPQKSGSDKHYGDYDTYEEAEKVYNDCIRIDVSEEDEYDRVLRRGFFGVRYGESFIEIHKYSNGDKVFLEVYKIYRESVRNNEKMNNFINNIDAYRQMIKDESDRVTNEKKEEKIAELKIRREEIENEKRKEFVCRPNYTKNSVNDCYTVSIPYKDMNYYYVGSFMNKDIVDELDERFSVIRVLDDFVEKYNEFIKNELEGYKKRDRITRVDNYLSKTGGKGYKWHKARNCWRVIRKIGGHEYCLGYFKDERCCKAMIQEFNTAYENGLFEKWYLDIEKHRYRIKSMFEDDSRPEAVYENSMKVNCVEVNKDLPCIMSPNVFVCQFDDKGDLVGRFNNYKDASRQFGSHSSSKSISECCRGFKRSYGGYYWRLVEER